MTFNQFVRTFTLETGLLCGFLYLLSACSAEPSNSSSNNSGSWNINPINSGDAQARNTTETIAQGGSAASSTGPGGKQVPGAGGNTVVTGTDVCADVNVNVSRTTPWVLFVLDGSNSMTTGYTGSASRWQAIYDTLMTPNEGVIATLESAAYFGILIFNGAPVCPNFPTVTPALNNYTAIDAVYKPAQLSQGTPTEDALIAAYQMVPDQKQILDTPGLKTQIVVLCTDGQPNSCAGARRTNTDAFAGPTAAVTSAAANGIKTYVISVASPDESAQYQDFLDQLAEIGNPGTKAFSPATKDDLTAKIKDIVGAAISCEIELKGKVTPGQACRGTVMLNSEKLACNGTNGWVLKDESHIELQGTACTKLKSKAKAQLSAKFPCDAVVIR